MQGFDDHLDNYGDPVPHVVPAQDHEIEAWVNADAWGDMEAAYRAIGRIKREARTGSEDDWRAICEDEDAKA